MKDRVPLYPGRVKLVPVAGQENTYDMVRADEPQMEGTPINKAALLKDATAALFGLGTDAVPDDVLAKIKELLDGLLTTANSKAKIQTGSYTGTGTYGASNPCSLTFDFVPQFVYVRKSGYYQIEYPVIFLWIGKIGKLTNQYGYSITFMLNGNTLSWYGDNGAEYQGNLSGVTYDYLAIG